MNYYDAEDYLDTRRAIYLGQQLQALDTQVTAIIALDYLHIAERMAAKCNLPIIQLEEAGEGTIAVFAFNFTDEMIALKEKLANCKVVFVAVINDENVVTVTESCIACYYIAKEIEI